MANACPSVVVKVPENDAGAISTWTERWLSPFLALGKCLQQESKLQPLAETQPLRTQQPRPLIT